MTTLSEDEARAISDKADVLGIKPYDQEFDEHGSTLYYEVEGVKYAIYLDRETWIICGEILDS